MKASHTDRLSSVAFGLICVLCGLSAGGADSTPAFRFSFGPGKPASGYTQVLPDMTYSPERGFGFEPGADLRAVGEDGNSSRGDIASDKPFFFSVAVPEGNYRVTVTLGDVKSTSDNTIKAELRRLMIERVRTASAEFETRAFIVNVRRPKIASGGEVRLTTREQTTEIWAWDDRFSLEFNGSHPAVAALVIEKVDVPTVYLMGDSTVCDQPREPFNSWGQMITRFLDPVLAVANEAESGESVAGALGKKRFDKIWSEMKKGDYLFVQFGHNDMKSKAADALERYTEDLRRVVDETRQRGGIPVLCTPVSRRSFDSEGKITNSFLGFPDAVRLVAREKNAPLIDLQNMAAAFYESMGPEASHKAFANERENTHHSNYGSYEIAKCVLMGIKQNGLDLAKYIVGDFKGFDPSRPDPFESFTVPASPIMTSLAPPGN